MELIFEEPRFLYFLLFIPLVISVHYVVLRYTRKQAIPFANFEALARISGKYVFAQNNIQLMIRILAIIFLCFALSEATVYLDFDGFSPNTVFVVDASESMLIKFNKTTSSFEKADILLREYASYHTWITSSVGVMTYSTISVTVSPFVRVRPDFVQALAQLTSHNIAGTDISNALLNGLFLVNTEKGSKRVVLITDGTGGFGLSIDRVLQLATDESVVIDVVLTENSNPNLLVVASLSNIAELTSGNVYKLTDQNFDEVGSRLATADNVQSSLSLQVLLLIATLVIMIIEWAISKSIYKTIPHE